jgi:hypothetical protein
MVCEGCPNRVSIPGNSHTRCKNIYASVITRKWPGCGSWPFNFNENIVVECDGKATEVIETEKDPMLELMRILS